MPRKQIRFVEDSDGAITGVEIRVTDDDGNERAIAWEVDDVGNVTERGVGPDGEKRGKRDPSGGGSNSLGV